MKAEDSAVYADEIFSHFTITQTTDIKAIFNRNEMNFTKTDKKKQEYKIEKNIEDRYTYFRRRHLNICRKSQTKRTEMSIF